MKNKFILTVKIGFAAPVSAPASSFSLKGRYSRFFGPCCRLKPASGTLHQEAVKRQYSA